MASKILNYMALKEEVVTQLLTLQELISGRGYEKNERRIKELVAKLKEDQVNLVILGYFNRGKSTFINSLLGENLLPTSIIPLTSVITLIKYGEIFRTDVYFKDNTSQEINVEDIVNYATELKNPRNKKNVERIEISIPAPYLKQGVVIVDTPGLSSVHTDNVLITQNYLPKADVAMLLLGADPPISQTEVEFLKELKAFSNKIFILQNKIDQVEEAERQQSLEFSQQIIETQVGFQNVKIHPISAKLALEGELTGDSEKIKISRLPDFEKALEEFLLEEKGEVVLLVSLNQGLKLLVEMEMATELERKAAQTPLTDLKNKIEAMNVHIAAIQQEQKDQESQIQKEVEELLRNLNPKLFRDQQIRFVKEALQACYEVHKGDNKKTLVQALETCFHESIQKALKTWLLPENQRIQKEFEEIATRFVTQTYEHIKQIQHLSAGFFNLQIEDLRLIKPQESENRQSYKETVLKLPGTSFLMPKRYFQKVLLQEILKKVEEELERSIEQGHKEFVKQIQHSTKELREALDQQIKVSVENIRVALRRSLETKMENKKEMRQTVKELEEKLAKIQQIKKRLLDIQKIIGL